MFRPALSGVAVTATTAGRLSTSFGVVASAAGCGGSFAAVEQRRFNPGSHLYRNDFDRKRDVLLKKQRIQGFRYKDRAAPMPPHKKYAVDPTAWNRADRAEARTERTAEVLVQRVLDRDVSPHPPEEPPSASDATLFGSDIVAHPPLPDSARLTAQAFLGDAEEGGVEAWVYLRETLRELRDPVQAQRRTPKTVQRMAAQLAEAYPALQRALETALAERLDVLQSIDSADDLLVVAELANDLRLVLTAAGVPPEQRGGYHALVDVVMDQAERLIAAGAPGEGGGSSSPDDATLLRAVALASLSASRGADAARMVRAILRRSSGTLLSGPALENLAMALSIDGVAEHSVWIVGAVEIAVRRTLAAARSLDARYDWGNIVPGTTTPVAPAAARFLCGAVKACISFAPADRVSTERLFRMAATLSQLLEITPNHAMPVPQVVGCAAAVVRVAMDDAVDDAQCERAVAPWLHTLARIHGRISTLNAADLTTLVQTALSSPADRAAEANRQSAVDRGTVLSVALLQAFAANEGLGASKEQFLDVVVPLCLAARVRIRPDVWRCVFRAARTCCRGAAASGEEVGTADTAAVVAATWLMHARVHETASEGAASDALELVRWSCEALAVEDLAVLVRVLPPVVVGGPLESLKEPLADAVFEAISDIERAEEDDGTDTGVAEEERGQQQQYRRHA